MNRKIIIISRVNNNQVFFEISVLSNTGTILKTYDNLVFEDVPPTVEKILKDIIG
ncbi:hypothetical protein LCGC14_1984880 [marine sediment metagenome]|uniref:Uncharacterized protein n=1 Tax=marine sediment metagenome TaxID=412755 RepID=A0A0F9FVW7_9ZZZZ